MSWEPTLQMLSEAVEKAGQDVLTITDGPAMDLIDSLRRIRGMRQELARLEDFIERAAVAAAKTERLRDGELPTGGSFMVRHGKDRKEWNHRALALHLVDVTLAESGEFSPEAVTLALLEAASVAYWRVGVMKKLGIDLDDFCASSPGRTTIQITAAS